MPSLFPKKYFKKVDVSKARSEQKVSTAVSAKKRCAWDKMVTSVINDELKGFIVRASLFPVSSRDARVDDVEYLRTVSRKTMIIKRSTFSFSIVVVVGRGRLNKWNKNSPGYAVYTATWCSIIMYPRRDIRSRKPGTCTHHSHCTHAVCSAGSYIILSLFACVYTYCTRTQRTSVISRRVEKQQLLNRPIKKRGRVHRVIFLQLFPRTTEYFRIPPLLSLAVGFYDHLVIIIILYSTYINIM